MAKAMSFDITKTSAYKQALDAKNPDKQAELQVRTRVWDQYFDEKVRLTELENAMLKASIELEKVTMTSTATAALRTSVDAVMADEAAVKRAETTLASLTEQFEKRSAIFKQLFGV